jgi:hypothetical protein
MPATQNRPGQQSGQLAPMLFWVGVGLTPLAVLLLLFSGGSGALRLGVVLVVAAVVLTGLAMKLRLDSGGGPGDLDDAVYQEMDALRDMLRQEIAGAVGASHRSLADQVTVLQEQVGALRAQLDRARVALDQLGAGASGPGVAPLPPPSGPARGRGVVQHTETVQVTTRKTIVDQDDRGTVYGSQASGPRDYEPPRERDWHEDDRRPADRSAGERPSRRGGGRDEDDARRRIQEAWEAPREESWTDQKLRERFGDLSQAAAGLRGAEWSPGRDEPSAPRADNRRGDPGGWSADPADWRKSAGFEPARGGDGGESGRGRRRRDEDDSGAAVRPWDTGEQDPAGAADPADSAAWSGLRAGDRWASVRTDDRGQELRVGERRASVHSDGSGSEIRIEDRWAAVRRDDEQRAGRDSGRAEGRRRADEDTGARAREEIVVDRAQPARAALPAAPAERAPDWARDLEGGRGERERARVEAPGPRPEPAQRGSADRSIADRTRAGRGADAERAAAERARADRDRSFQDRESLAGADRSAGDWGGADWGAGDWGGAGWGGADRVGDGWGYDARDDDAHDYGYGYGSRERAGRGRGGEGGWDSGGRQYGSRDHDDADRAPRTRDSEAPRARDSREGRWGDDGDEPARGWRDSERSADRGDADGDDQWERRPRTRPAIPRQRRVEIESNDERWS